eukprot:4853291-Prymnesium_polylepis.1
MDAPPDVRDVESIGNRLDTFLTRQYCNEMKAPKLPRRGPARSRRIAELETTCCLVDRAGYVVPYAGPFPGPAAPTPCISRSTAADGGAAAAAVHAVTAAGETICRRATGRAERAAGRCRERHSAPCARADALRIVETAGGRGARTEGGSRRASCETASSSRRGSSRGRCRQQAGSDAVEA